MAEKVAIIEDSLFIREAWRLQLSDQEVVTFASVEDFRNHEPAEEFTYIICDHYLPGESGLSLLTELVASSAAQLFLMTNASLNPGETPDGVKVIGKDPVPLAELDLQNAS